MRRYLRFCQIFKSTMQAMRLAEALLGSSSLFKGLMVCMREMQDGITALNAVLAKLVNPVWAHGLERPRFVN